MANKLHTKGSLERYPGTKTANWQSGVATSGLAGADLVTIGANDQGNLVHSLNVDISALTAAANITVRLYQQINGTEKLVHSETFIKGTDPDGIFVINGSIGIEEALRAEVMSDNVLDNAKAVAYEYTLEER